MQSLLGASPVVFLRQAEDGIGQIDMRLTGRNNARLNFSSMHVNVKATGETDAERAGGETGSNRKAQTC